MPTGTPYTPGRFRGSGGDGFCEVIGPGVPGDLLLTGSPAGNGAHYGRYLRPGEVMESTITGPGRQRNRSVQP